MTARVFDVTAQRAEDIALFAASAAVAGIPLPDHLVHEVKGPTGAARVLLDKVAQAAAAAGMRFDRDISPRRQAVTIYAGTGVTYRAVHFTYEAEDAECAPVPAGAAA